MFINIKESSLRGKQSENFEIIVTVLEVKALSSMNKGKSGLDKYFNIMQGSQKRIYSSYFYLIFFIWNKENFIHFMLFDYLELEFIHVVVVVYKWK